MTRTSGTPGGDTADSGWWTGPELEPDDDYGFVVDGEGPFPDPRSTWQPHGVHELSRAFDTSDFEWTDGNWAGIDPLGAVQYELHVGTFTPEGTLDAAALRLPYLASVGIAMVELMPLSPAPGERGWGYDGVGPFAVHEAYGGPAALQRFVDAAHQVGLAVCLDTVFNHLGPDGNYLARFGPYFTDAHHTPWGWAVNLDQPGSSEVRRYLIDAASQWFADFHVDALRLDAVHALHDDSETHFLAELSDHVAELSRTLGRRLTLIAESDLNDDTMVTPTSRGGLGQDLQWADDVHHALHAYLSGERHGYYVDFGSIETLDKAFRRVFVHDGSRSTFRGRDWGRPVRPETDKRRFVVFASNHDQVGNRALGDRPSSRLSAGAEATALALVLLSPFTPMLFMGEEYGEDQPFQYFTDHAEPLGAAVTKGRLSEFAGHGWETLYGGQVDVPDPQDPATFERSKLLHFDDESPRYAAMRQWVAEIMRLRPATTRARAWDRHPVSVTERDERVLTLAGPVAVHANLSAAAVQFDGRPAASFGGIELGDGTFVLAPDAVALVEHEHS